jgi:hypothetical protein
MTWREAVSDGIARLTLRRGSNIFTRQLLLDEELSLIIKAIGSSGKTPAQTMSRVLQELRDSEEIEFIGNGEYRLLASVFIPATKEAEFDGPSARIPTVVSRIARDTGIVRRLKIKYGFRCQICGERIELKSGFYCEAHHLRPLGIPHDGPDVESNLIIVCPNHHTQLDYTAIPIDPSKLKQCLHGIDLLYVEYHNHLCRNEK